MNFGEKLFELRAKKNLSQGDVADALGVSRQSVSKWENNSAVPDLDKIIRLAELFEVSLDELVLNKKETKAAGSAEGQNNDTEENWDKRMENLAAQPQIIVQKESMSGKKIAGTMLMCTAFLVVLVCTILAGGDGLLAGILLAVPFVACGIICFTVKRHTGLWCLWTIYIFVDSYLRWATGISWKLVLWTSHFKAGTYTVQLIIAWVEAVAILALFGYTVFALAKEPARVSKRRVFALSAGAAVLMLLGWFVGKLLVYRFTMLLVALLDWAIVAMVVAAVVAIIRYLRSLKQAKEEQ